MQTAQHNNQLTKSEYMITANLLADTLSSSDLMLIAPLLRALAPDPVMSVSEWADEFRELPPTVSESGKFRISRTPYLKEILDRLSVSSSAQEVIFKKAAQIGATEAGNNWVGSVIHLTPGPMMYVMPTDALMKDTSKNRIQKMIDVTPVLQNKVKPARSKDSGNTMLSKEFQGGFLKMVGANSPVGLRSTAVRFLYMDEIDGYPTDVGGEGDAIALAKTRTVSFGARKKMFLTSTPTLEGVSIIDKAFEKTGQRFYHVPCPCCGDYIILKFEQLRYDKEDFRTVKYECQECGDLIEERHKGRMLALGEWRPLYPELEAKNPYTYGYHLSAMYSPPGWYTWADMAKDFEEAQGDLPKLITFTNTKLGEVYKIAGESPEWKTLYSRREKYTMNRPPADVVFITAGADVQKDRVEVEIVGWGKGKQSWSISYRVLLGNTDTADSPVWDELAAILSETWIREDGAVLPLRKMGLDTGYNTSICYAFCKKHNNGLVIPVKGREKQVQMVAPPQSVETSVAGKRITGGTKVWNVATTMIKGELYGWLKLEQKDNGTFPFGYCHFPEHDEHYFRSITAEKYERKTDKKGFTVYSWVKKYQRNEVLDLRVYARAAAYVLGIDNLTTEDWDKLLIETKDLIPAHKPAEEKPKPKRSGDDDYWKRH